MDPQSSERSPKQQEIFPVPADSVNKTLKEIAGNPDQVLESESEAIKVEECRKNIKS